MRWLQIARKDFDDARRNRQLYYLVGIFGLIGLGVGYFMGQNAEFVSPGDVAFLLLNGFAFFAPIAALTISQSDIVGKRTTGELSVLLSLPFSRLSIVAGSFLGRVALLTAMLAVPFILGPVLGAAMGIQLGLGDLLGAYLLVWVLGIVFTGIAIGISTMTRSTSIAAGGSFGVFLLFVFQVWALIPWGVRFILNGFSSPTGPQPEWAAAFVQLSPYTALRNAAHPFLSDLLANFPLALGSVAESPPWYQGSAFAGAVVLAWIFIPLALGYYRFRTTDL